MNKNIYNFLKENNEKTISDVSLKTYTSHLNKLFYHFNSKDNEFEPEFFLIDYKNVIKFILDDINNISSQKTYLASILNCLKSFNSTKDIKIKEIYNKVMSNLALKYDKEKENQKMNEKERNNWISQDEIKKKYDELYDKYISFFNIKGGLNSFLYDELQQLIILSLYYMIPPRRLSDYTLMKIKNYNDNDNYIDFKKKKFVFNQFKTRKYKGETTINIPKDLLNLIKRFVNLNYYESDYLLNSNNGKPLSSSSLNKRLNNIFNKKVSCNMLRKSYISDYFKDLPKLKEINELTNNLGNSMNEVMKSYIKK